MPRTIYELVEIDDKLPFDVSLHQVNYVPSHWHNSVEIIFVLNGKLEVRVGTETQTITEGDICLINQSHVHEVVGLTSNIIATFLVPVPYLKVHVQGIDQMYFDALAGKPDMEDNESYRRIRHLLAELVLLKYKRGKVYELDMQTRMLSVFAILIKQFRNDPVQGAVNEKYKERMLSIINYIDDHYKEPISLQALAEREYLSVPYLSKFFSENIGLNFQSYLTSIRLKYAVEELLRNEGTSVADIGSNHGFPNMKSFYTAFKNKYHKTPNEYRQQYERSISTPSHAPDFSTSYAEFSQTRALDIIEQFLEYMKQEENTDTSVLIGRTSTARQVNVTHSKRSIQHTWKNLITIGKAKEGLHADVQDQLRYLQARCPFNYLRFHGIFDDEMMVYDEVDGEPRYHFRLTDQLFDFLLSIGIRPFIELGFMPSKLAQDPEQTVFRNKSCVSPPISIRMWCELIDHFVRHCVNRYGLKEVSSWRFEFWNEPELAYFWPGSQDEYKEMYLQTYRTLKSISTELQIGAPGRILMIPYDWFAGPFYQFCRENNAIPDFIPVHYYPNELVPETEETHRQSYPDLIHKKMNIFSGISKDSDRLNKMLNQELTIMKREGLDHLPIHITEFNSTTDHRELTNDTLYKAAYIAKNIVENLDKVESFGYWVLSDNIEEFTASCHLYHGGMGLMTQYGIPKAAMLSYELLSKLGDQLLDQGEGFIVTRNKEAYQILAYNYCHYDELYLAGDVSLIHQTSRYHRFKDEKILNLEIALRGLPECNFRITRQKLTRQQGSSYDAWVRMGAPEQLSLEDIQYLKSTALPERFTEIRTPNEAQSFVFELEPHAVELIEISPLL